MRYHDHGVTNNLSQRFVLTRHVEKFAVMKRGRHNLRTLYGVNQAPCDTYLRERLDEVDPQQLRGAYTTLFRQLQRGKGLEDFQVFGDHYLLSVDGTGQYGSSEVSCKNCCQKRVKDKVHYYHQLLAAVLVHPDHKPVLPLMPEPITQQDGQSKNDCERLAGRCTTEISHGEFTLWYCPAISEPDL